MKKKSKNKKKKSDGELKYPGFFDDMKIIPAKDNPVKSMNACFPFELVLVYCHRSSLLPSLSQIREETGGGRKGFYLGFFTVSPFEGKGLRSIFCAFYSFLILILLLF